MKDLKLVSVALALAAATLSATDYRPRPLHASVAEVTRGRLARMLANGARRLAQHTRFREALEVASIAHRLAEDSGEKATRAVALAEMGFVQMLLGHLDEGEGEENEALVFAQQAGEHEVLALVWKYKGDVCFWRGASSEAMADYDRSLEILGDSADPVLRGRVLYALGVAYLYRGDYPGALGYLEKSVAVARRTSEPGAAAHQLCAMGDVHSLLGDYGRAMEHYEEAFHEAERGEDPRILASSLSGMGRVYSLQAQHDDALEYHRRALSIAEEMGAKPGVAMMLADLAEAQRLAGRLDDAVASSERSLRLAEEVGMRRFVAAALGVLGDLQLARGEYGPARDALEKELALAEELGVRDIKAAALTSLVRLREAQRDYVGAVEAAARAASLAREIGSLENLWPTLSIAGRAHRALGHVEQARLAFEEAVAAVERLRMGTVGADEARERFFEEKVVPYYGLVDLLVEEGRAPEALSYAESAKGRVLLDALAGGRVQTADFMTPDERAEEARLVSTLTDLNAQISQGGAAGKALEELEVRRREARLEYEDCEATLYRTHPEMLRQRGQVKTFGLDEAGALLAGNRIAFVEYVVGQDRTHVFVLTGPTPTLTVFTVEMTRRELSRLAEEFRDAVGQRAPRSRTLSRRLYDVLLKSIEARLARSSILAVVPDGALWEVPFQALMSGRGRYVIEDRAVFYAPSLGVLREMSAVRHPGPDDAPTLLGLGDPALRQGPVERVAVAHRGLALVPLPEAAEEVRRLGQIYGPSHSLIYTGQEAREDRLKAQIGQYDVVHLATHGVLDDASPMYSYLVLASGGDGREDGLLEAWEIAKLKLRTDVAVLSACQTARGRLGPGEGVTGMAWAFFLAGCPTTVVSFWNVESEGTEELMVEFHRRLRTGRRGGAAGFKAEALRQAALRLLRSDRYGHPFYWASFAVIGDGGAARVR
jgi:CHAT domain-containing protein/tetratricopeptide (TPR) repeat protein